MTTQELIAILKKGAPVTFALVREITYHLERLEWTEKSLRSAMEKYGPENVPFTRDECSYVCDALDDCERLKDAVRWEIECADWVAEYGWSFGLGDDAMEELCATYNAAWREVEKLVL